MPVKFRMSLSSVKGSLKVTLPKEIVEALDLHAKEKVLVSLTEDNKILIEKSD